MNKSTILICSLVAISFTAVLALVYFTHLRPQTIVPLSQTPTPIPTTVRSAPKLETYVDDTLKIEINYPSTYIRDISQDGSDYDLRLLGSKYHTVGSDMGVSHQGNWFSISNNQTCSASASSSFDTHILSISPISSNEKYSLYKVLGVEGPDYKVALFKKPSGGCLSIVCLSDDFCENETLEDFNQILSTFKFTDKTASWKTYRNEKYGFEFQYLSDTVINAERPSFITFSPSSESEPFGALIVVPNPQKLTLENYYHQEYLSCLKNRPPSDMPCWNDFYGSDGGLKVQLKNKTYKFGNVSYSLWTPNIGPVDLYWWQEGNFLYKLEITSNKSDLLPADQILSTFKFTN